MINRFLEKGQTGTGGTGARLMATATTWLGFFLLGSLPVMGAIAWMYLNDKDTAVQAIESNNMQLLGLPEVLLFVLMMLQFVLGLWALRAGLRWWQRKRFKSVITGHVQIRWNRMLRAGLLWMGMMGVMTGVQYLIAPATFSIQWQPEKFLLFIVPVLALTPLQCAFEEMAIRGQLMQNLYAPLGRRPWIPIVLTSVVFAVLHGFNAEVGTYGFWVMMLYYFSFGIILSAFAVMDEGLEVSIGVHAGNNLFFFLFLSYPGVSVSTPGIFQLESVQPLTELLWLWILAGTLFIFMFRNKLMFLQKLFAPSPPTRP